VHTVAVWTRTVMAKKQDLRPHISTAIRIPESLHADLLAMADRNNVSVNLLVKGD
jgi:predicted HicB family RNase H-like nuclease